MCILGTRKYSPELPEVFAEKMAEYFVDENKPWMITGLCIHLHIYKDTFYEYAKIPQFSDSIKLARQMIENYSGRQLFREVGQVTGIIFNLKNNFGWVDKFETENKTELDDKRESKKLTEAEAREKIEAHNKKVIEEYKKSKSVAESQKD